MVLIRMKHPQRTTLFFPGVKTDRLQVAGDDTLDAGMSRSGFPRVGHNFYGLALDFHILIS